MQLWIQRKINFRVADVLEFMLIVLDATKLTDYLPENIILAGADGWHVAGHEAVNRKDIRHLDI